MVAETNSGDTDLQVHVEQRHGRHVVQAEQIAVEQPHERRPAAVVQQPSVARAPGGAAERQQRARPLVLRLVRLGPLRQVRPRVPYRDAQVAGSHQLDELLPRACSCRALPGTPCG